MVRRYLLEVVRKAGMGLGRLEGGHGRWLEGGWKVVRKVVRWLAGGY